MKRSVASVSEVQPSADERAFMVRRLLPFISPDVGIYPIEHLLMEAYMQGLRDADAALAHRQRITSQERHGG